MSVLVWAEVVWRRKEGGEEVGVRRVCSLQSEGVCPGSVIPSVLKRPISTGQLHTIGAGSLP
jgi:hypothetical protein